MVERATAWDRAMLKRFKKHYEYAFKRKKETFHFEGNVYLIGYAMYLIEYLEGVLAP